jgi:hypothetical protein
MFIGRVPLSARCYLSTQEMPGFTCLPLQCPGQSLHCTRVEAEDACHINEPVSKATSQQSRSESAAFPTQTSSRPGTEKEHKDARLALPLTATQGSDQEPSPRVSQTGATSLPVSSFGPSFPHL